jgi:glutathione S-transferase
LFKEGSSVFTESTPICEYLDECNPIPKLIPTDQKLRYETRRLTCWFDDKFYQEVTKNLLNERVYKKIFKTGHPDSNAIKDGLKKIKFHFDYLEWLLEKRNWLAGEKMTLADFSAVAHISSLDYIGDINWELKPIVKEWYAKIKSRPAFRTAGLLNDLVPGFVPASHYSDLDF